MTALPKRPRPEKDPAPERDAAFQGASGWVLEKDLEESVLDYLKAWPRRWLQGELHRDKGGKTEAEKPDAEKSPGRSWQLGLFILGLMLYLSTRLIAIQDYPITFFSDEAIQTLHAQALLRNGLSSPEGRFLPLFFSNAGQYNLSFSVYLQLLVAPFARSVALTRAVPAVVSLLAPLLSGLALRDMFKQERWWLAPFVFSAIPAWFLHSRTALETSLGATMFAVMLYAYLNYRLRNPKGVIWAVLAAALCFYSYAPLQMVVICFSLMMLVLDWPYHWQNRKVSVWGLVTAAAVVLPYLAFRLRHPQALSFQLNLLDSYWLEKKPLVEKLGEMLLRWLKGLDPLYWFLPNTRDLARHSMGGYAKFALYLLPFTAWGLVRLFKGLQKPENRVLLAALLAAPSGAALVEPSITRLLVMVVPLVWLSCLGMDALIGRQREGAEQKGAALTYAVILGFASFYMLADALQHGDLWTEDYGLYGMQWGAPEVFNEVQAWQEAFPQDTVVLSPTWANGTDILARYCLPDGRQLRLESYKTWTFRREPLDENTLLVMTPEEYVKVLQEAKFEAPKVVRSLAYPNGLPGFYFVRLQYSAQADALFAEEAAERQRPMKAEMELLGRPVSISYPRLDIGSIDMLFDGDMNSLVRGLEANPFTLEIEFLEPVSVEGLELSLGAPEMQITATVTMNSGEEVRYIREVPEAALIRPISLRFDAPHFAKKISLSLEQLDGQVPAHVHIWELKINP